MVRTSACHAEIQAGSIPVGGANKIKNKEMKTLNKKYYYYYKLLTTQ